MTAKPVTKRQLCLTTTEKISDRVFTSQKEMKRQLGLAPGFPLELTHNPNPKLEIPAVPFNSETRETGAALHTKKDALVQQEIYVTPSEKFKIKFRDIFTDTVITHRSSHESRRWLAGPNFEY